MKKKYSTKLSWEGEFRYIATERDIRESMARQIAKYLETRLQMVISGDKATASFIIITDTPIDEHSEEIT